MARLQISSLRSRLWKLLERLRSKWKTVALPEAVLVGAVIIAMGTFLTNVLHDLKERADTRGRVGRQLTCQRWDESARLQAFAQVEEFVRNKGSSVDARASVEYWVALAKVQRWYLDGESGDRISRPEFC